MTNLRKLHLKKIFIFDQTKSQKMTTNPLKDFIYYLKFKGLSGIIDFSYSFEKDSMHKDLTIKENFILDAIPTSLIRENEDNLNEFLKTLQNPHLAKLIENLDDLSCKVSDLSNEKLKLASIIKAILSPSEYIFLVEPEKFQASETLKLIKDCINFESENDHRVFLIQPLNRDIWLDSGTHFVMKCEKTHHYIDYVNPLNKVKKENKFVPTYNFGLMKKVG